MKGSPLLFFALPFAIALLSTVALPTANGATTAPATSEPIDTRTLVTQIDERAETFSIMHMRSGKIDTYTIDQFTKITVNDRPGTFTDIKVGMQARSVIERDGQTLDILSVGAADTAPPGTSAPKNNS